MEPKLIIWPLKVNRITRHSPSLAAVPLDSRSIVQFHVIALEEYSGITASFNTLDVGLKGSGKTA